LESKIETHPHQSTKSDEHHALVSWLWNDKSLSEEEEFALDILNFLLLGAQNSKPYESLLDSGSSKVVISNGLDGNLIQNTFSVGVKGITNAEINGPSKKSEIKGAKSVPCSFSAGDVMTKIDKRRVENKIDLFKASESRNTGDIVNIAFQHREGFAPIKNKTTQVKLASIRANDGAGDIGIDVAGVLLLSYSAATIEWMVEIVALPLYTLFAAYSCLFLAYLKKDYPGFKSFTDASNNLVNSCFSSFKKASMILNLDALAIYLLIATADAIGGIHNKGFMSYQRNLSIIAAIILVIPCECRDFHMISKFLSVPSTLPTVIAVIIVITYLDIYLSDYGEQFGARTQLGPGEGVTVFNFLESLFAFVFAYQGQSIYMEIMVGIKNPNEFLKSYDIAYSAMAFIYYRTIVIGYGVKGESESGFLPDILDEVVAKFAVGIVVCLHIMVSYVIARQPLYVWIHACIFSKTLCKETSYGKIDWFIVAFRYIVYDWIICNVILLFADVQVPIGSLFGALIILLQRKNLRNLSAELNHFHVFDTLQYKDKELRKDEYKNYKVDVSSMISSQECKSYSRHRSVLDMNELFTPLVFNVTKENIFIAVIMSSLEKGLIWSRSYQRELLNVHFTLSVYFG